MTDEEIAKHHQAKWGHGNGNLRCLHLLTWKNLKKNKVGLVHDGGVGIELVFFFGSENETRYNYDILELDYTSFRSVDWWHRVVSNFINLFGLHICKAWDITTSPPWRSYFETVIGFPSQSSTPEIHIGVLPIFLQLKLKPLPCNCPSYHNINTFKSRQQQQQQLPFRFSKHPRIIIYPLVIFHIANMAHRNSWTVKKKGGGSFQFIFS